MKKLIAILCLAALPVFAAVDPVELEWKISTAQKFQALEASVGKYAPVSYVGVKLGAVKKMLNNKQYVQADAQLDALKIEFARVLKGK